MGTTEVLAEADASLLKSLERVIATNIKAFVAVGRALTEIRDKRLYRSTHSSFESYCKEQWEMSKPYATQVIAAAAIVADLTVANCNHQPQTESQARPLSKLPKEKRAEVWEKAVEASPKVNGKPKPTAKIVQEIVEAELADEPAYEPEPSPMCDYLNQEIPESLNPVFEAEELFEVAIGHAKALSAAVKEISGSPAGGFLNAAQINRLVRDIRALVNEARPYALCPYCHGRKCSACAQSGVVPNKVLEAAQ